MFLQFEKRNLTEEVPRLRMPRQGRPSQYQQTKRLLDEHTTKLSSEFPQQPIRSIRQLLEELEDDIETVRAVLRKDSRPVSPPLEPEQNRPPIKESLVQQIIGGLPTAVDKARAFLTGLFSNHEMVSVISRQRSKIAQFEEQNRILKRAFYKLMVREQERRHQVALTQE
jgi:hypothetical protein